MDVLRTPDDRFVDLPDHASTSRSSTTTSLHNDLSTHTADGSWDLPVPATFVIDRSGIVRARYVSADYTTRMDPDDIEAALAALD